MLPLVSFTRTIECYKDEIFSYIYWLFFYYNIYIFFSFRDKPLCLYLFTENIEDRDAFIANTSSGGVCVNDALTHFAGQIWSFILHLQSYNFKRIVIFIHPKITISNIVINTNYECLRLWPLLICLYLQFDCLCNCLLCTRCFVH